MKSKAFYQNLLERMRRVHANVNEVFKEHEEAVEAVELLANREDYFCCLNFAESAVEKNYIFARIQAKERLAERIAKELLDCGYIKIVEERETRNNEPWIKYTAKVCLIKDAETEQGV